MKTLCNPVDRRELIGRLSRLTPGTPGQWGTLNAPRMVTHLIDSARMMVDEIPGMPAGRSVLSWPGLKQLIVYVLPVPRGKARTHPLLLATQPTNLPADIATFAELLERFGAEDTRLAATHPAFGTMTREAWGILGYKHFDHHLKQFGI